jgi:hypothetical protein
MSFSATDISPPKPDISIAIGACVSDRNSR